VATLIAMKQKIKGLEIKEKVVNREVANTNLLQMMDLYQIVKNFGGKNCG